MMPIYGRMMDSHPHQRNQSEYQQTFPSHNIPLNPSHPPMLYQPYTYPYPVPFNSCCNHGNFPGFHGHIPSYPQPMPSSPQPLHYCPRQPFSACYFPPSPHYSTGTSGYHEHDDRGDEPARDDGSLIPVRVKGYPYPVAWVPREYAKPLGGSKPKYVAADCGDETRVRDRNGAKENEKEAIAPPRRIGDLPFLFKFLPLEQLGRGGSGAEAKREEGAAARKNVPVKPELPPACLGVDPLPRQKKNGNVGSRSRSPSPPKQQNKGLKETVVTVAAEREEVGKRPLSEVEAALRVQSAYRGYEIRRSQPLKKLKRISEVREQVADVRNRIRALESSSDVRRDDKQRLIVGETIMRLLLQLDTIQGLLPSLRDVRRALAKELVSLQDKLDSLVIEPEKPKSETCSSGPMDVLGVGAECKQEKPEETLVIESEKPKLETGSSGPVDVLSVEAEEVECKQEKPEEIHVIESENPESETYASGPVDVVTVEAEYKQETPEEIQVIESEKPESETYASGPEDVVTMEAEYKQQKPEEILVIESEACDSGPVDVLGVETEEDESKQEKPEEVIERDRSCDDVPERSFDVIGSDGGSSDAVFVPCDCEMELTGTKQSEHNLESEKADEAQLTEDSQETHVMENPWPTEIIDGEKGNGGQAESAVASQEPEAYQSIRDEDSIEVKKPDQVVEATGHEIENEKLREMMEKLLEAGEKQLNVISGLSARVKDLEKKLYTRNKLRTRTNRRRRSVVK